MSRLDDVAASEAGPGAHPSVSVIVPVFNGADALARCLQALADQDYAGSVEVLVVDNASTEPLAGALPDDPRFTLLHESRKGSYAARNNGLARATGEVIAFTDGDCRPAPDWLTQAVAELMVEPRADMVGGAVELTFVGGRPRRGPELYEAVHGFPQHQYLMNQHFAVTANMVTWRRTFDAVGLFDADLQSRGDAQWGQRVAAAGGIQRFAAAARVAHPARATWGELRAKILRVARGRIAAETAVGLGARHFTGIAWSQLLSVARAVSRAGAEPIDLGPAERIRYLIALAVCRSTTAGLMLRAATQSISQRGGTGSDHPARP